jgi:hypothetical protein
MEPLSAATIAALRARHIAFLAERLTDERAHGDFVRSFSAGYDHVLAQKLRDVVQPAKLVTGVTHVLTSDTLRGLVAPVMREIHRRVLASLKSDATPAGDYVPEDARDAIDEVLARADLVPEAVLRKIIDDEAIERIMHDLSYDALIEFNETVNPFFADWGLPALIKRFIPVGAGAVLKSMSAVSAEFDKRLEPEIRKFLLGFSRRSKKKLADYLIANAADPKLVHLRQSVARVLYVETIASLTKNVDDDARMELDDAALGITLEVLGQERPREQLLAELEKLVREHGDETLGDWLARIGVSARPELEALAELLWPYVKLVMESPPARAFWERVTWDFYASLE